MRSGRIAIVIAAWNLRDYLREGLSSLGRETKIHPCDVTVVDNGSTDGSAEMVTREFPAVCLIRNEINIGFVRASNLGARRALEVGQPDYILFLNADVVVRDGAVDRLADYLDAHSEVAAAAPLLVLPDGRFQPGPAGFKPTLGSALAYFSFGGKICPRAVRPLFLDPEAAVRNGGRPVPVGWLSGACLMVRSAAVGQVGLMNEEYSMYADDIEWGIRISAAGLTLRFLPSVRVTHHHGITAKTVSGGFNTLWLAQLFRYVRANCGPVEAALFRLIAAAGFGLRAFVYALRALAPVGSSRTGRKPVREMLAYAAFSLWGWRNR